MSARTNPKAAFPYAVATPKGVAHVRGKREAVQKARELVGAPHDMSERVLEERFGVVIARASEEHARRHGI